MAQGLSNLEIKSLWREKRRAGVSFLCPLCKTPRMVPHKTSPGLRHVLQVAVTATFIMAVTWSWFEWKGIVSFAPLWIAFEMIYRIRARGLLACPHCGFDPYLQLTDAQRARQEIEAHWRRKFAEKGIPYPEKEGILPQAAIKGRGAGMTPGNTSQASREPAEGEDSPSLTQ